MSFLAWVKKTIGYDWDRVKMKGITAKEFHYLMDRYNEYCKTQCMSPSYML